MSKLPSPAVAVGAAAVGATAGAVDAAVADVTDRTDAAAAWSQQAFAPEARAAVYRAILERRDMRHFSGGSVDPETLRIGVPSANDGSTQLAQPL